MRRFPLFLKAGFAILCVFIFAATLAANSVTANTYTGTVKNGTTNKPASGVDVILLSLEGNMETVANTKTDAQGHFHLTYNPTGQMPLLVRAIYKGVNFHAMLPPGTTTADVQVFEPSSDNSTIQIPSRLIVFQPNGSTLLVGEEYVIQNESKPPVTYFKSDGDFDFQMPDGATNTQVSAQGPEKMPLTQGTMDRGKNRYAIAYAFRPGESEVRLSYEFPYSSNTAALHLPTLHAARNVVILVPPTVTLSAPGFQAAGTEQGMTVYSRDEVAAGTVLDVSLSGTAPPPSDGGQQAPSDSAASSGRDSGTAVSAVAPRLDTLKWVLLGGFAALFMLGAGFLIRKPVPVGASVETSVPTTARRSSSSAVASTAVATGASAIGAVDREVGASLDELKDRLFRLELRHQAGTISDADYTEQRSQTEKILRDLVRG
jgi:hypothetical protein